MNLTVKFNCQEYFIRCSRMPNIYDKFCGVHCDINFLGNQVSIPCKHT